MLAAVLWLGNISFTVIDNENHVQAVENEGKRISETLLNECIVLLSVMSSYLLLGHLFLALDTLDPMLQCTTYKFMLCNA